MLRTPVLLALVVFTLSSAARLSAQSTVPPSTAGLAPDSATRSAASAQIVGPTLPPLTAEETLRAARAVRNLCMFVDGRTPDETPGTRFRYRYQRMLLTAANAVEDTIPAVIRAKMQRMWTAIEDRLICNNLQFDVGNGSVLKFGVATNFDDFISDVIAWGVNLNKVDETDERTLLDYVGWQMEKNEGNPIAVRMGVYYRALRRAGAKHRSEL